MLASKLADSALVITALGVFIATATGAWISFKTHQITIKTHTEVKTLNGLTLAQMADAEETRRVDLIAPADRTAAEQRHLTAEPRTQDRP